MTLLNKSSCIYTFCISKERNGRNVKTNKHKGGKATLEGGDLGVQAWLCFQLTL